MKAMGDISFLPCFNSIFNIGEISNMNLVFVSKADLPFPMAFVPIHAIKTGLIVFSYWTVFVVFIAGNLSKVAKSVIGFYMVYVVNLIGNIAVNIKPNQTMNKIGFSKQSNNKMSVCIKGA